MRWSCSCTQSTTTSSPRLQGAFPADATTTSRTGESLSYLHRTQEGAVNRYHLHHFGGEHSTAQFSIFKPVWALEMRAIRRMYVCRSFFCSKVGCNQVRPTTEAYCSSSSFWLGDLTLKCRPTHALFQIQPAREAATASRKICNLVSTGSREQGLQVNARNLPPSRC